MKKVLSLVLAVVLVFGMTTIAFAAPKIDTVNANWNGYAVRTGALGTSAQFDAASFATSDYDWGDEVRADSSIRLYMKPQYFDDVNGTALVRGDLTSARLSSASITVKKKVSKGSELIDNIEIKNDSTLKSAYISVELIDPFVSTSSKDFDFTVYLAKKGSKITDTEIQITGTMENEIIEIDADEDEVNLSEGHVAKALDYNKGIKVDTGNGLFINTKMFDGKKYYAKSVQEITQADDAILSQYPEIDTVYTLHQVNLNTAGNSVEFDIDEKYYVYNADGAYIGTTTDKLPMSSKYYLATKMIDMDGANVDEPGDLDDGLPVDPSNPITGGDDIDANDNPGTGANGFVNVAAVAGLVALAAAGAVSRKK